MGQKFSTTKPTQRPPDPSQPSPAAKKVVGPSILNGGDYGKRFGTNLDTMSHYYGNLGGSNFEKIYFYSPQCEQVNGEYPKVNVFKGTAASQSGGDDKTDTSQYTFSTTPIRPGESVLVRIHQSPESPAKKLKYPEALGVGFLSCDPKTFCLDLGLSPFTAGGLDALLRRQRYWPIEPSVAVCQDGDEFCITFDVTGELSVGRNGGCSHSLMHGSKVAPLWVFFCVCGPLEICLLGKLTPVPMETDL